MKRRQFARSIPQHPHAIAITASSLVKFLCRICDATASGSTVNGGYRVFVRVFKSL
jgi:hypothetical protein